jgi:uncharacterized protein
MLQLSQINIYPVKSLDGYSPDSAIVEKRGLQYDRRWLITDTEGVFITQRTNGKMALLQATIEDNYLIIKEKQNENSFIKILIGTETEPCKVVVWDDTIDAKTVSTEADKWLSDFLGKEYRLVKMPENTERRVDADYNTGEDIVSFADGYPFLIIGEASMKDLNERLEIPLSIRRFRANFIFTGGEPFQEDGFKSFKIGKIAFLGVKNCARCVLTTRDPDTGIKGKEPLQTLTTYRQKGTKILFGQNVLWQHKTWNWARQPEVKVGDVITLE